MGASVGLTGKALRFELAGAVGGIGPTLAHVRAHVCPVVVVARVPKVVLGHVLASMLADHGIGTAPAMVGQHSGPALGIAGAVARSFEVSVPSLRAAVAPDVPGARGACWAVAAEPLAFSRACRAIERHTAEGVDALNGQRAARWLRAFRRHATRSCLMSFVHRTL
jgi:hypothetical protein